MSDVVARSDHESLSLSDACPHVPMREVMLSSVRSSLPPGFSLQLLKRSH